MVAVLVDGFHILLPGGIPLKEDIKEQPTSRNLSATATRVL
jgi:hypothetical protein